MRLPPQPNERIDRGSPLDFTFDGAPVRGFEGDTLGSALFANGRRVFSRSFKYHRPRGLLCCEGHCPNCMMTVNGVPNVRVCVEPLRQGADARSQNVLGRSVDRDFLSIVDRLGGRLTPVGFYYRTMIRPRRMWPVYESALRKLAGLGKVPENSGGGERYDVEHRRVDVLVIGGGASGHAAAAEAAAAGREVLLVDDHQQDAGAGDYEVLAPAHALGIYESGLVPVDAGNLLFSIRATRIVVATGSLEQPLVFPGNDLVGVMLPTAVRRLVDDWSIKPGMRAAVVAADAGGLAVVEQLARAGVEIAASVDLSVEPVEQLAASGRRGRLASVTIDGRKVDADLLVASGARQPAYSMLAQAGGRVQYEPARGIFVPTDLPREVEVVGSARGEFEQAPTRPSFDGAGDKCFVCVCEDVTVKDVKRAIAEGFDSIELAKRYTTVTMGPCQGKLCHLASVRLMARETGTPESVIGTTTARPPWQPVELGLLAGRHYEPMKRSPIHARHEALGAQMVWTGQWQRPQAYGDAAGEVRAVHESLGVIDVSTLGKIIVEGPDASKLLDRLYPNRFSDLRIGRIRYGVLTTDGGRILDDGTVARLSDERFYVTTTSTGAESVAAWFEWWNTVWGYDAEIVNVTGGLGAVNLAGPRARAALAALTEADVSNDAFRYLDAKQIEVAGVTCLALRIGFVGELGYELHCAATVAERLWDALVMRGAAPVGLEAQRVLRLEKGHVIVGQDTDSESTVSSAGLGRLIKDDKEDFVGKLALPHTTQREWLVGFTMSRDVLPLEGAQIVRDGRPAGRVTSARSSDRLGAVIGLAWIDPESATEGQSIRIRVDGRAHEAVVTLAPFYDPEGVRVRS